MSESAAFPDFIRRIHAGDNQAARELVDLRAGGYEWTEIAARLGGTADARRKQLARAVDRVEHQLTGKEIGDD